MKKFSQFDLLNNAVISATGKVISGIFESKYIKLELKVPKPDAIRGSMVVSQVNRYVKEINIEREKRNQSPIELFTFEKLVLLLYEDYVEHKFDEDKYNLSRLLMRKKEQHREEDYEKVESFIQKDQWKFAFEEVKRKYKYPMMICPIRIYKDYALQGEMLLYDLSEAYVEFNLTLDELMVIIYRECMKGLRSGNPDILKNIVMRWSRS
jgi:hypothetical protein